MRRPPSFLVIAGGVVGFVLAGAGSHALVQWLRREPAVPAAIVEHAWLPQHIGRAIEFDAPFALAPDQMPIPDAVKPLVVSTSYLQGEADGMMIGAMAFSYREGVTPDLDAAAAGAIANMRTVPGTLSISPKTTKGTLLGKPAVDVEATIRRDNAEPLRMHGVVFAIASELYVTISVARADQPAGDAAWQKLRASIHIVR